MSKLWLTVLILNLSGCASKLMSPVSVYMGDPAKDAITRSQVNKSVKCADPDFSQYVCLLQYDFIQLAAKANQCEGQ